MAGAKRAERTSTKARRASRKKAVKAGKPKFPGTVRHTPPASGATIRSGDHVVAAIREVRFGDLPESGARSELLLDVRLATSGSDGQRIEMSHSTGPFFHVPHGEALSVADWVVFDGLVRQHLSIQIEITELESPRRKRKDSLGFAKTLIESVGRPSTAIPDPVGAVLGTASRLFGAVLALDADDQVLKHFTSLRTAELAGDQTPPLVEGTHLFEKLPEGKAGRDPGPAFVTLKLRIQRVDG